MKKLEELGISPAPWREWDDDVVAADDSSVVLSYDESYLSGPDANLIAAAPELYEALREAVGESCLSCPHDCTNCINLNHNWIPKAKAALAKAGGKEAE